MLISFTIFHKGGLIVFQHLPDDTQETIDRTTQAINTWLTNVYFNPTKSLTDRKAVIDIHSNDHNSNVNQAKDVSAMNVKQVVEWQEQEDLVAVALYPDLRQGEDHLWIGALLSQSLQEFQLFSSSQAASTATDDLMQSHIKEIARPMDTSLFDKTFELLFQQMKNSAETTIRSNKTANAKMKKKKLTANSGKEKRHWHDGKAKVTKEAMAELDFSKTANEGSEVSTDNNTLIDKDAVALAEARAAYLPTDADLANFSVTPDIDLDEEDEDGSSSSWSGSLKGLFQQATGQKVLCKDDLEIPLQEIHKTLTGKNVAADIAQSICDNVESSLVGKKLSSMYRVKTAVRQALEKAINKLLLPSSQLDLLRQVVSKRDALFGRKKPYVIVVVGINGVGKSTSLAKLAYFLKTNGCKPLLAACDTFRSGAVEQLSVHAKCLDLPIFHQGYSKDPSNVAKAAIEQATKEGNDVVLVDTAGRMQNNVPLMKALGKLAAENQPDLVVFVGEALVGNDGVDQVRMFNQAVSSQSRSQKVSAILLTKFDTVSDKVGAALTMTHVTNAPILFVGTGQKYHHLQKLSTPSVIRSLFQ